MGSFTPLVLGTNGGMGTESHRFLKHLAEKLSQKDGEPYHFVIAWLRTLLSFEILRSVHTSVRGSRTPFRKIGDFIDGCCLNFNSAGIHLFYVIIITIIIIILFFGGSHFLMRYFNFVTSYIGHFYTRIVMALKKTSSA